VRDAARAKCGHNGRSPENTRLFTCSFDADGKMTAEMHHGDSA
jgi:hypothetical protein